MAKTMVAVFDELLDAERAVRGLLELGLARDDVGVFAHEAAGDEGDEGDAGEPRAPGSEAHGSPSTRTLARERLGAQVDAGNAVVGAMTGAFVGLGLATVPVIGPILAIGPLALGAIGASLGERFATWFGALTAFGIPAQDAGEYAEAVRRGGVVVVARVHEDWCRRAARLLEGAHAVDLGARAEAWRSAGWEGYDDQAPPLTDDEVRRAHSAPAAPPRPIPLARASIAPDRPSRPSLPM
jgi:hypothetical protein